MIKYDSINHVIRQIPYGKVATYGQIAGLVPGCTPRMVGYALASLKPGTDVPWFRVINRHGKISLRSDGGEDALQRHLLEAEGIQFDRTGRIDLEKIGWRGLSNSGPAPHHGCGQPP
ncbi:MAG: MGMT family protein [Candidatus Zhuqueibacterota bacterium]